MKSQKAPPQLAMWILKRLSSYNRVHSVIEDFEDTFREIMLDDGIGKAKLWCWKNTIVTLLEYFRQIILWSLPVLKNHIKIAFRNILRKKGVSFINISGLAIGLACSILILFFVIKEMSYDDFHLKGGRIYRLETDLQMDSDHLSKLNKNGWPVGRLLAQNFSEVEEVLYMRSAFHPLKHNGSYYFDKAVYADNNFFKLFSFELNDGDSKTALERPFTVVITDELQRKYFGDESALGKSLTLSDTLDCEITGIIDLPQNSHLQFDYLISFKTFLHFNPEAGGNTGWGNFNMSNYLLLKEGVNPVEFQKKIYDFPMKMAGEMFERWGMKNYKRIEPLGDIYLRSESGNSFGPSSSIETVYFMLFIACLMLLIGCFNFVNLATARSIERAKEIGLRKVIGSTRSGLIRQFLTESFIICFVSLGFAMFLMVLILPLFNDLTGSTFKLNEIMSLDMLLLSLAATLVVSLLAGAYPAIVISRFMPVEVLKGKFSSGSKGNLLRKVLVVSQFVITSALIFSTITVRDQLTYMLNIDLGFNMDQIVVMNTARIPQSLFAAKKESMKQALQEFPSIQRVTASYSVPGKYGWSGQVCYPEGMSKDEMVAVEFMPVDHDYVKTFGLNIIAGRDYSKEMTTDLENALIINETAVKHMGWASPEEAIGKKIDSPSGYPRGLVIGVFKDYNHYSLHENVYPTVLDVVDRTTGLIAIKTASTDMSGMLEILEDKWEEVFPGYQFSYFFLDEFFARQYSAEKKLSKIFGTFALLGIIVACLGLYGLIAFSTSQKTKEIGIRKTLGASVSMISIRLVKEYLKLITLALFVALPGVYFIMEYWLSNFVYRIDIGLGTAALTVIVTSVITFLTIGYKVFRAASANPIESIRYE